MRRKTRAPSKASIKAEKSNPLYVEAINVDLRAVVLSDGTVLPITKLLDHLGEETDDPKEAAAFIAGEGDLWVQGLISGFETQKFN